MGCPSEVEIGDNLVFSVTTHDPDTGVLTDADAVPTYRLYEDETATPILTGSMAKLDDANTTGFYSELIACSSGNGFENGKTYTIYIEATVDGDKGGMSYGFKAYDQRKATIISLTTAAIKSIWDQATSALSTAGSIGKYIVDNVNTLLTRLSAVRAGYLDKLNITGNAAASGEVTAIQNNTRVRVVVPDAIERPDSGSTAYKLHLYIYDTDGNMEAPDSTPTIAAENQAGTDRSGNLGTVTLEDTGHYSVTYTVASGHAIEQVLFEWSVIENSVTRLHGTVAQVVDTTAVDYTAADRTRDDAIKAKTDNLPGSPAAVGSEMNLADDAITAAKHDETTAFPLKSADTGATQVARTGADGDTLEDLSDQLDAVSGEESRSHIGTAQAGTSSTITLAAGASSQDNIYKHGICFIHTGTGAGEFQIIDSYVGSTRVATMAANWVITPDNASQYRVLPLGTIPGASAPTAAQVADAVLTELIADHKATSGSLAAVANEIHCATAPKKKVHDKSTVQTKVYERDGTTVCYTEEVSKGASDDEVKVIRV